MNTLFVGNLPFSLSESDVRQLFEGVGQVKSVKMPTDRETGRKRGFGFVEMDSEQAASDAIHQLNCRSIEGRDIVVSLAKPRAA